MKESKKRQRKLTIIGTSFLIILLIGATYAYFTLSNGDDAQGGVHITSNTTDSLMFKIERDISLTLDTDNFLKDSGNQSDSVWAKAELLPNNKTNEAHDKYNMYFVITDNEFNYVTNSQKAEILLKVIDTKGTDVETDDEVIDDEVEGLSYVTITDGKSVSHSGYDITNAYGLYKIISEKRIDANGGSELHKYKIEVVFLNYNENQSKNAGKTLDATILLSKEDYEDYEPTFINTMNITKESSSIETLLKIAEGSSEIDKYYFKIEKVEKSPTAYVENKSKVLKLANEPSNNSVFKESDSASYTFTEGLEENKEYNIYAYTVDKLGIKSNIYKQKIVNSNITLPIIKNVEASITNGELKIKVNSLAENIEEYCYSMDKVNYKCSNINNYIFENVNVNNTNVYVYIKDNVNKSLIYKLRAKAMKLSEYIIKLYNKQTYEGENGIYLHDGMGMNNDYNYGEHEAGIGTGENATYENSYRFSGASNEVNNYVCFGGECEDENSENLYRIIGVFDGQVKIIKATKSTSALLGTNGSYIDGSNYVWDRTKESNNTWSHSTFNLYNLNSGYTPGGNVTEEYGFLYKIGTTWADMIADHTWKVGGNNWNNITTKLGVRNVYNNEIGSTNGEVNYTNKVGLMYVSDYMYASDPRDASKPWSNLIGYNSSDSTKDFRAVASKNWLCGIEEWMLTRITDTNNTAWYLYAGGTIVNNYVYNKSSVRPTFYLSANVSYDSGIGTKAQPIIIK